LKTEIDNLKQAVTELIAEDVRLKNGLDASVTQADLDAVKAVAAKQTDLEAVKAVADVAAKQTDLDAVKAVADVAAKQTDLDAVKAVADVAAKQADLVAVKAVADAAAKQTDLDAVKAVADAAAEKSGLDAVKAVADAAVKQADLAAVKAVADAAAEKTVLDAVKEVADAAAKGFELEIVKGELDQVESKAAYNEQTGQNNAADIDTLQKKTAKSAICAYQDKWSSSYPESTIKYDSVHAEVNEVGAVLSASTGVYDVAADGVYEITVSGNAAINHDGYLKVELVGAPRGTDQNKEFIYSYTHEGRIHDTVSQTRFFKLTKGDKISLSFTAGGTSVAYCYSECVHTDVGWPGDDISTHTDISKYECACKCMNDAASCKNWVHAVENGTPKCWLKTAKSVSSEQITKAGATAGHKGNYCPGGVANFKHIKFCVSLYEKQGE